MGWCCLPGFFPFLLSRLRGTVIFRIWWQCLFMVVHTIVIIYLHNYVDGMKMNFPFSLVRILAGPTGLLLVFRTNTAYDRYWEGRKIWGTMTYQIRSLTMSIWLGVEDKIKTGDDGDQSASPDDLDKASVLNLLVAFIVSTKNHLRGTYSYDRTDIQDLIGHIPRFKSKPPQTPDQLNSKGSIETVSSEGSTRILFPMEPKWWKDHGIGHKGKVGDGLTDTMKAHDFNTPSNIPLEIVYCFFSYLQVLKMERRADAITMKCLQASLLSLMDCLTGLERILKTPIPLAYSIHLKFTVWLFLLALPYQFVQLLNWWTIPAVLISSMTLLGILAIGGEIENPFGYDENDLPLDDFCDVIRREMQVMVARSDRVTKPQSPTRLAPLKLPKGKIPKVSSVDL